MNKRILTSLVLVTLLVPVYSYANNTSKTLSPVVVTARRNSDDSAENMQAGGYTYTNSRIGVLGKKDVMDIPFTQVSLTEKTVEDFGSPALPLQQALVNIPSVRLASSSPMYTDFSVRGIGMNGTHVYFNDVPSLFSQFRMPPNHMIERIDLMVGPGSGLNGTAASSNGTNSGKSAAPGVMNVTSKRAGQDANRSITMTYTGKKNIGTYLDLGSRVGKNREWGYRIYGGWLDGQLQLNDSGKTEKTIGLNIDHRDDKSKTNFFIGHIDLRVDGAQRWFTTKAKVMPKAPDANMEYDFPETTKWAHWYVTTLNHTQKLNDNWEAFFNGGTSTWSGSKYNMNASLEFDAAGNFINNKSNLMNEKARNSYYQIGIRGNTKTGNVKHNLVASFDRSDMSYWKANFSGKTNAVEGNLYDGITYKPNFYPLPIGSKRTWSYDERNYGITVNDMMEYGKWNVLLGATYRNGKLDSATEHIHNTNILPTFGVSYRVNKKLSIYGGHSESFSRGQMVTNPKYANKDAVLDPVKQKQNEIGIKYNHGDWISSLAYFNINQGNFIDEERNGKTYLTQDGMNEYKGLEASFNGKVNDKLTLMGGFVYMDAKRKSTSKGLRDGWFVTGVPDFSATIAATYAINKNVDVIGRMLYAGPTHINDNGAETPGYTTFDLGLNWKTHIGKNPLKVHAMVYNLFDKSAWMGRAGSTTFGLTWPRTVSLSATLDF